MAEQGFLGKETAEDSPATQRCRMVEVEAAVESLLLVVIVPLVPTAALVVLD